MRVHAYTVVAGLWLFTLVASCSPLAPQTDPSRFYVLHPTPVEPSTDSSQKLSDITFGVGPFELSPYLERSQLVTRVGPNEVSLSTVDRWAEPLREGIMRIMEENLVWYLEPQDVISHPWTSLEQPDYAIQMEMAQFERSAEGDAELWAIWVVRPAATGRRSAIIETKIVEPVDPPSSEELVKALSHALARRSQVGPLPQRAGGVVAARRRLVESGFVLVLQAGGSRLR